MKKRLRFKWKKLITPVIMLIALSGLAFAVYDQEAALSSLENEKAQLEVRLAELNTERDRLTHMIDYADTPAYAEQIARDVLGWVKDGETRFDNP